MVQDLSLFLKNKLNIELARRSLAGSITFASLAIAITLTKLITGPNADIYRHLALSIAIINFIRFGLAKYILRDQTPNKTYMFGLHVSILLNPILWSILLFQVYDPASFHNYNSSIAFLITAGIAVGSTYSLAPFILEALFFQIGVLIPLISFAIRSWQLDPENVSLLLPIVSIIFLLYTIAQTIQNRRAILESARFEHSLIESNENLQVSQKLIQDQSVRLMHASRLASLGEMAGGIAHEINNPLTVIMGSIRSIQKNAEGTSGAEKIFERTGQIQGAAMRIKNIVSGLFSFAGQSERLPPEKTNARVVVEDTLSFCNEKFRSAGIEVQTDVTVDHFFHGRANQVSQIILNLLNNSYDAVRESNIKWIRVSLYSQGNFLCVDVTDSGPGISSEMKGRLFQPFATTKEVGKGTGLGLSIARGLAREQGGDVIHIETAAQTNFRILLPLILEATSSNYELSS